VRTHWRDIRTGLPFPDQEFDLVVCGEVVEHMEDPAALVREMCRVCGGHVVLSTVDMHCEDAIRNRVVYPDHLWDFQPEDLTGLFDGLGDVTYYRVGNYHFVACARRDL
jgi:SAM-dependent methyltransferase